MQELIVWFNYYAITAAIAGFILRKYNSVRNPLPWLLLGWLWPLTLIWKLSQPLARIYERAFQEQRSAEHDYRIIHDQFDTLMLRIRDVAFWRGRLIHGTESEKMVARQLLEYWGVAENATTWFISE